VALRHRDHPADLLHACIEGQLQTAGVGHQRHHAQGLGEARAFEDLRRVGHLRQRLGADEGADLEAGEAAGRQRLDERDLGLGRDQGLDGLEAVARSNLENFDG